VAVGVSPVGGLAPAVTEVRGVAQRCAEAVPPEPRAAGGQGRNVGEEGGEVEG
jgi:hypothetical protein